MTAPASILEVSRSYDGYVLICDATSPLGLRWRLMPMTALHLIDALAYDFAHGYATCSGTVETVGGTRVRFEWPRARVEQAVVDLARTAALCQLRPEG